MVFLSEQLVLWDCETTDNDLAFISGGIPEIVEIGAILIDKDLKKLDEFTSLVCPQNPELFSENCEALTGIKRAQLEQAKDWAEVWREFAGFTHFAGKKLCSWGTSDMSLLRNEYSKRRLGFPHNQLGLDALSMLYWQALREGMMFKGFSLKTVCESLGIERPKRHRALPDALTILEIWRLLSKSDSPTDIKCIGV